ncbi:hypothetical protein [Labilithrix luteola]|nr:hypothetical protein [Labilithrix luteola]
MTAELSTPDIPEEAIGARRRARACTAWVFVLTNGFLLASAGLYWLARGRFFDPRIYEAVGGPSWTLMEVLDADVLRLVSAGVRFAGMLAILAGILVMAVGATAFRRGERWAWYAMLALPLYVTLDFMALAGYGALSPTNVIWDAALMVTALFALVVPYRRFFPPQLGQVNP